MIKENEQEGKKDEDMEKREKQKKAKEMNIKKMDEGT